MWKQKYKLKIKYKVWYEVEQKSPEYGEEMTRS